MPEHFRLPGDQRVKRTYDEKTRTLHVEQVRTASVQAGSSEISQEDWDMIFNKKDKGDDSRGQVQGINEHDGGD